MARGIMATSILAMKAGKPTKAEKAAATKAAATEPEQVEVKMPTWAKLRRMVAKLVKRYETDLLCLAADCKDPHLKPLWAAAAAAHAVSEMYRSLEVDKPWYVRERQIELEEVFGLKIELPAELVEAAEVRAEKLRPAREAEFEAMLKRKKKKK